MWTIEDIEELNPAESGQKASVLAFLLKIGAAWPQLLCQGANELEERDSPWVCCFTQLPFEVSVEAGRYRVAGLTDGVQVELEFQNFAVGVGQQGDLTIIDDGAAGVPPCSVTAAAGTQVRAFVQLWGRRVLTHNNYLSSVRNGLPSSTRINPRGSKWGPLGGEHKGTAITQRMYGPQLAVRLEGEVHTALQRFLSNYSVVAIDEVPQLPYLFSYFIMPIAGRVTYSAPPRPILGGMLRTTVGNHQIMAPKADLEKALSLGFREIDRYQHQLVAMSRLAREGEPELALVGCLTAIEWYMNSFLPPRPKPKQLSVSLAIKESPFQRLTDETKHRLRQAAMSRNAVVHGKPPSRRHRQNADGATVAMVREAADAGLRLYREMNDGAPAHSPPGPAKLT